MGWRAQRDESPRPGSRRFGANREPVLGVGTEPLNGEEVSGDSRENDNTEPITIRDCRYEHRFVLEAGGAISELVYEIVDDRMIIEHTGVPEGLRERGLGGELVRAAAARARDEGLTVVPECPFAQHWLRANPDVAATIRVARTATD